MNKDVKQALKIATGLFIVPLGIVASKVWPWWMKRTLTGKIVSGFFVLPFMLIAAPLSNWWDNF